MKKKTETNQKIIDFVAFDCIECLFDFGLENFTWNEIFPRLSIIQEIQYTHSRTNIKCDKPCDTWFNFQYAQFIIKNDKVIE